MEFASFDANTPRFQPKYPPVNHPNSFHLANWSWIFQCIAFFFEVKQNVLHQQVGETPGLEAYKKSGIQEFIGFSAHALKHLKNSLESVWLVPQQAIVVKIPKSFKRLWMQHHARHAKIDQVQHHQCGKAPKG